MIREPAEWVVELARYRFIVYSLPYTTPIESCVADLLRSLLTEDEKKHYDRMMTCTKQCEYLLSRAMLRSISGVLLNRKPEQLCFARTDYGKPYLKDMGWSLPKFFFNVSHTEERILLAVTTYGEIGVDIETIGAYQGNIARRFFHHDEYIRLESLDQSQRTEAFYQLWTIKEACVKALGFGIQFPLREIYVFPEAESGTSQGLCWQTIQIASPYKAAVAIRLEDTNIVPCALHIQEMDIMWLLSRL